MPNSKNSDTTKTNERITFTQEQLTLAASGITVGGNSFERALFVLEGSSQMDTELLRITLVLTLRGHDDLISGEELNQVVKFFGEARRLLPHEAPSALAIAQLNDESYGLVFTHLFRPQE